MSHQDSNLVWGAAAIGKYTGTEPRKTFYLLEKGLIPATKVGGQWVGERDKLRNPACWPRKTEAA